MRAEHGTDAVAEGLDHEVTYTAHGTVVRRRLHLGLTVENESALLEILALALPLPVPHVRRTWPQAHAIEMDRVPGQPLLDVLPTMSDEPTQQLAQQLAAFLEALHRIPIRQVESLVPVEPSPIEEYHHDAVRIVDTLWRELPPDMVDPVRSFLAEPLPVPPERLRLGHTDIGAEHVFVDTSTWTITGVIDWSDASITDPCLDLGLVWRDLGEAAFDTAARHVVQGTPDGGESFKTRSRFYARVRALEDFEFGLGPGRGRYLTNAVRALNALF